MSQKTADKKTTATKKKLIDSIAHKKKMRPEDARQIIQAFLDKITESLAKGERLEFRDFGIFDIGIIDASPPYIREILISLVSRRYVPVSGEEKFLSPQTVPMIFVSS